MSLPDSPVLSDLNDPHVIQEFHALLRSLTYETLVDWRRLLVGTRTRRWKYRACRWPIPLQDLTPLVDPHPPYLTLLQNDPRGDIPTLESATPVDSRDFVHDEEEEEEEEDRADSEETRLDHVRPSMWQHLRRELDVSASWMLQSEALRQLEGPTSVPSRKAKRHRENSPPATAQEPPPRWCDAPTRFIDDWLLEHCADGEAFLHEALKRHLPEQARHGGFQTTVPASYLALSRKETETLVRSLLDQLQKHHTQCCVLQQQQQQQQPPSRAAVEEDPLVTATLQRWQGKWKYKLENPERFPVTLDAQNVLALAEAHQLVPKSVLENTRIRLELLGFLPSKETPRERRRKQ